MTYFCFSLVEESHKSYVYSLGICEVNRRILSCLDVKSFEEANKLKGFSPWHKTNDHANWPEKPKALTYQRIHKYSEVAPWCTYALEYSISVAASSLSSEDLARFTYSDVPTKQLFDGCILHPADESKMKTVQNKLEYHLNQYNQVVSYPLLQEKFQELERGLVADDGLELCEKRCTGNWITMLRRRIL